MATSEYRAWVAAGKPWDLARPITELVTWAEDNQVPVLGTIGDRFHLQADFPEDHTPFSYTAWPVPLPGYWVCAVDLADTSGLGEAILAGARAGRYPWLKYMNFDGRSYAFADGFQQSARNPDFHVHLSVFSDDLSTSIGDFDPWGADMESGEHLPVPGWMQKYWPQLGETMVVRSCLVSGYGHSRRGKEHAAATRVAVRELDAKVEALAGALEGLIPGVVEAVSDAVANVTAEDVADELEVRVRGEP